MASPARFKIPTGSRLGPTNAGIKLSGPKVAKLNESDRISTPLIRPLGATAPAARSRLPVTRLPSGPRVGEQLRLQVPTKLKITALADFTADRPKTIARIADAARVFLNVCFSISLYSIRT